MDLTKKSITYLSLGSDRVSQPLLYDLRNPFISSLGFNLNPMTSFRIRMRQRFQMLRTATRIKRSLNGLLSSLIACHVPLESKDA